MALPLVLILALTIMRATCTDPNPLQDFCVADTTSTLFLNGFPCLNPSTVTAAHFKTSALGVPGNTSGQTYSVGWDDTLRVVDEGARTFTGSDGIKLSGQPRGLASTEEGYVFVALASGKIAIYLKGQLVGEVPTADYTPTAIAAHGSTVAVGSSPDPVVHIYKLDGSSLKPTETLKNSTSAISALAFDKSGKYLAAGTSGGKIVAYDTASWKVATDRWSAHTARVTTIAWNDAATHAASGGLDTNVFVWSLAKPGSRVKALNAHKDGVSGVAWVEGSQKVASAGVDAALKIWNLSGLQ